VQDVGERQMTASVATRTPRRALLVGINDYPNPDDRLEGCVNDVFKMSATLQQIGFDPEDVRVLFNERATAAAIRERFAWLLEDPQAGDQRVFFYSGHGAHIPDYNSDEIVDHTDETLVPYDFNWDDRTTHLTDDDFKDLYAQLPYETTFVAFLDCCHSGGMTGAGGAKIRGLDPPDDIRHRMLKWNFDLELWEPRDLAKERGLPDYLRETSAYTGKSGATNRIFAAFRCARSLMIKKCVIFANANTGTKARIYRSSSKPAAKTNMLTNTATALPPTALLPISSPKRYSMRDTEKKGSSFRS
jgi:hypothetical protein